MCMLSTSQTKGFLSNSFLFVDVMPQHMLSVALHSKQQMTMTTNHSPGIVLRGGGKKFEKLQHMIESYMTLSTLTTQKHHHNTVN